jgi:predicted amidohydrolase
MKKKILSDWNFRGEKGGWLSPTGDPDQYRATRSGMICSAAKGQKVTVAGPGVHTRNNDSIELSFSPQRRGEGVLTFGFMSFSEYVRVQLDLKTGVASLSSSDCTRPQRLARTTFSLPRQSSHCLVIEKREGSGDLVKNADVNVYLNDKRLFCVENVNVAPELGVLIEIGSGSILLQRFKHRGVPTGIPEYLHVAALQVINSPSMEENLKSILRGLQLAADRGVQLLVTPETSITGLFPFHPVSNKPGSITAAERKIRRFMRQLNNAPYLVAGLPVWMAVDGHRNQTTRYNASRLYDPEGHIVATCPKIHVCEDTFWHGYRLHEFDIYGVPTCLHICHDIRYPEVWTLPVMFGSRLILHPCNGGTITGSIEAAEQRLETATHTSHAFYVRANGGGESGIAGPQKGGNIIAISDECGRDAPSFPMVGEPLECLVASRIRMHDAFGYWPVRSFRASEQVARAYVQLYRAYGGAR